jgi:hypothetical protein
MKLKIRMDQLVGSFMGTATVVILWHWLHPGISFWQIVKTLIARLM